MACNLTSARGLSCKDTVGGVKAIYFADFDPLLYGNLTFTSGELATTASSWTAYRYDVRPNSSGLAVEVSNEVAGSASYKATLEVVLHTPTQADSDELQKLIQGRTIAWVWDANENLWSLGLKNGCVVEAGTMSIGTARTDLHGYTLTITAEEAEFPIRVVDSADASAADYPFDGVAGTGTITVTNPS